MDERLEISLALYRERVKIVVSSLVAISAVAAYLSFSPLVQDLLSVAPPMWAGEGWVLGNTVFYGSATLLFVVTTVVVALVLFAWLRCSLPYPLANYILEVLNFAFGFHAVVFRRFGGRFRTVLPDHVQLDILCKFSNRGREDGLCFQVSVSPIEASNLEEIAMRHGLHVRDHKLGMTASADEFRSRTILLAAALGNAVPKLGLTVWGTT
ncbi:MAG: hypothetical protein QXS20_04755 [Candidatus Thorarchaeota archaeon]